MKKIPFNQIKTKEELLTRVEAGNISVGNKIKYILKFLDKKPMGNNYIKVNVISNSMQDQSGVIVQEMFINIKEKTNEQKIDDAIEKFGLKERTEAYYGKFLELLTTSERYSFAK